MSTLDISLANTMLHVCIRTQTRVLTCVCVGVSHMHRIYAGALRFAYL